MYIKSQKCKKFKHFMFFRIINVMKGYFNSSSEIAFYPFLFQIKIYLDIFFTSSFDKYLHFPSSIFFTPIPAIALLCNASTL